MDLFHRASRVSGSAPWRPMIKLAAARMSEPPALPVAGVAGKTQQLSHAWTDLPASDTSFDDLRCEQLRLGTTAANYICHAVVRDFFAGRRAVDSAGAHLTALAKLQTSDPTADGRGRGDGSVALDNQDDLMNVAAMEQLVINPFV